MGFFIEKPLCGGISLLKRLFMEGGSLSNRFVEGICLIAMAPCGGEFLLEQTLCKGISLLKRLLVKRFTLKRLFVKGCPY